jgi:hypothetical protein
LDRSEAAAAIVPLRSYAMLSIRLAQSSIQFGGNTRLPMVAGWDNLLTRLVYDAPREISNAR